MRTILTVGGIQHGSYCGFDLSTLEGAKVKLIKEPDNEHDENAIIVEHEGYKLGYISAYHAYLINKHIPNVCNGTLLEATFIYENMFCALEPELSEKLFELQIRTRDI